MIGEKEVLLRALLSIRPGGPDALVLREAPTPDPAPGEILIRVATCGVNYPDVLIIQDKYQTRIPRPFAPGGEIAGIVERVGDGVGDFRAGDRVAGLAFHGGMAELIAVPARRVFRLPDHVPGAEGAMLLSTYATCYHALRDRGRLANGETLLVLGAAGGVGLAAVELGKAFGARIVAAVSSEAKAAAARRAGADDIILYPRSATDNGQQRWLADAFKERVGEKGANVVLDPVGGAYAAPALRAIAWGGRYLVIGFTAGIANVPLNLVLLKGCEIAGVFMGALAERAPDAFLRNIEALFALYADGRIRPLVTERYPLARGGEAIARLAERDIIGKVVVTL